MIVEEPDPGVRLDELVETLSRTLEVPVEITDTALQTVAESAYFGDEAVARPPITPQRRSHHPPAEPVRRPIVVPAVPELGLPATHVAPLVAAGVVSHYLWLVDVDGRLDSRAVGYAWQIAQASVQAIGRRLGGAAIAFDDATDRHPVLVTGSVHARQNLLEDLVGERSFAHDGVVFAISVSAHVEDGPESSRDLDVVVRRAAARVAAHYPAERSALGHARSELALMIAPYGTETAEQRAEELSIVLRDHLYRRFRNSAVRWIVGVSDVVSPFTSAAEAVRQALGVARVGARLGWSGRTAHWSRLGHLRILSALPEDILEADLIPPRLATFLSDPGNADLVDTLVSFLDNNGSVRAVAAELYLHRASVYHRMKRIQSELQVDLSDGNDRLETQLSVMAWRLLHPDSLPPNGR